MTCTAKHIIQVHQDEVDKSACQKMKIHSHYPMWAIYF